MIKPIHKIASLPKYAYLPMNRCNLPSAILGSLTYQQHPASLIIDSVPEIYREIFIRLKKLQNVVVRSRHFMDFMSVQFQLESPEEMGYQVDNRLDRSRATYLKLLRGWFFNSDSQDGAVLKGWTESRFGLIPRFHRTFIRSPQDDSYHAYVQEWARGLYNTNALESQIDLIYSYCQFELEHKYKDQTHLTLYRGCNSIDEYEMISSDQDPNHCTLLLNNLNSFSTSNERACEFGDYVMEVKVPISKIAFYSHLLSGLLKGEDEYVVIGGLYNVRFIH